MYIYKDLPRFYDIVIKHTKKSIYNALTNTKKIQGDISNLVTLMC